MRLRLRRTDRYARALRRRSSSARLSAHFTASSAGMPWTAFAYMSVMMYLESTSAGLARSAGPAIAGRATEAAGDLVGRHHRILVPHLVLLPLRRRRRGEALLRDEPLLVDWPSSAPTSGSPSPPSGSSSTSAARASEVGVHRELARRALRQRRVQDVGLQLRALLGLVLVGLAQRLDVDRGAVERRADGAATRNARLLLVSSQARPPSSCASFQNPVMNLTDSTVSLVLMTTLPLVVDLLAAQRPQERIGERRRIAEGVAERLADRAALGLQLLADLAILLPGLGELLRADLLEPRLAIGDHAADDGPRHARSTSCRRSSSP